MVRWGVLGLGRAANSFANAIKEVENAKLTTIASLSKNKNSKFGEKFNIPKNCQFNSYRQMELQCERAYQIECKAFALARTIKWKNGINPGKGKISKINSRLSDTEIRNQLRDLGFLN